MKLSFKFQSLAHHTGHLIPGYSDCKYTVNKCICEVRFLEKNLKKKVNANYCQDLNY
jgi:hypothetical protein